MNIAILGVEAGKQTVVRDHVEFVPQDDHGRIVRRVFVLFPCEMGCGDVAFSSGANG